MGYNMDFSKWWSEISHEIEYLVLHNYLAFFEKNIGIFRNPRFPFRSVFIISVSLFTSVVCYVKMDNEENTENARYATNDDTPLWTKRLNHLVLLYKCICVKIMSLNTCNKNVDMIWQYCIIFHIKPWFLKKLSQILGKTHWSIWIIGYNMAFFISHAISNFDPYKPSGLRPLG